MHHFQPIQIHERSNLNRFFSFPVQLKKDHPKVIFFIKAGGGNTPNIYLKCFLRKRLVVYLDARPTLEYSMMYSRTVEPIWLLFLSRSMKKDHPKVIFFIKAGGGNRTRAISLEG
jgi:hypothetical protein